jgi:hypothetical protein
MPVALMDPVRRSILEALAQGPAPLAALQPARLTETRGWLDFQSRFWSGSFYRLDALLNTAKDRK